MRLSYAAFAEIDGDEATITAGVGQLPVSLPGEHQDAFPRVPGRAVISKTLDDEFSSSLMLIWLPRKSDKKWLMCLGPKQTEEPFKKDDITLAESIAGQISTILDNLELLEQMKTQTVELRELNRQIVTTQEEERARVASYLHDEPLQEVSNVLWQARVEEVSPEIIEKLEKINDDLRNFSKMLHPAVLENLGLVKALDWLAEEAEQSADFVVETQFVGLPEDEELEKQTQIALYRIVQESLTNCQKHSLASTVCLRLSIDGDIITLVIEDDGVGIQTGGRNEPSMRLGLIGMRERAQQLRGRLRVVDRKPTGTKVIATLPAVYKRSEQRMSIPSVEVEQLD
jgi:signal transduction histidine kinase